MGDRAYLTGGREQMSVEVQWTETDEPNGPGCENASVADELRLE